MRYIFIRGATYSAAEAIFPGIVYPALARNRVVSPPNFLFVCSQVPKQPRPPSMPEPKTPPPDTPENARTRCLVVISFWSVVLLLGLPLWWLTTSIYRAPLPLKEMQSWASGRVRAPDRAHYAPFALPKESLAY